MPTRAGVVSLGCNDPWPPGSGRGAVTGTWVEKASVEWVAYKEL